MPADKLEGFSTLLRARLLIAEKDYAAAAREAMSLVRVNPRSNYAPDLLKLAAAAYRESGNEDRAQESLRQLVENYPESPLAAEAADQSRDD
jgi:TolA-binding protein